MAFHLIRPLITVTLALLSTQTVILLIPKEFWSRKFATKRYFDFNKLPINTCNKLFDTLFLPILLYGSEIWGAYDNMDFKKWEKDPIERQHTQFYKYFLSLNRRAPNVVARNETGRLPLKNIFEYLCKDN